MNSSLRSRLDAVLAADPQSAMRRARQEFAEIAGENCRSFVLVGAGALGMRVLKGLRSAGIEPLALADNNPKLWNTQVEGLTVLSLPDAVRRYDGSAVFVATVYNPSAILDQLRRLQASRVVSHALLSWHFADALLPHCDLDLPRSLAGSAEEIRQVFNLWEDDESREEFVSQIEWRFSLDSERQPPHRPPRETYFPGDLLRRISDEALLDCGAFSGDTLPGFFEFCGDDFERFVGLEPDPGNFARLEAAIRELPPSRRSRCKALPFAVGARNEKVRFDSAGSVSSLVSSTGGTEVDCVRLDDLASQFSPTYIKMDIEGGEPDAIAGAANTLRERAPVLAVCLYHAPEHLWTLPAAVAAIQPGYRFFLRRYAEDCWELVLYAIPPERLAAR